MDRTRNDFQMNPTYTLEQDLPLELVPRRCTTQDYQPIQVPSFQVRDQFIAYASPESTYAVTRQLIQSARHSILIGIYDFTAGHMRDLLLDALRRGVKVSLMLDLDNLKGENELYEALVGAGVDGVPAPSCASRRARYFPSCHEKVIVIDDLWSLVQSGNYTEHSIPENEEDGGDPNHFHKGNRDMGIAVRSAPLAAFFTRVLRGDMQLEIDASLEEGLALEVPPAPRFTLEAPRPPRLPPELFPSRRYLPRRELRVLPVLSPDNYMAVVPDFLASARQSISIEQQYIRADQPQVRRLLTAISDARQRNPQLTVRIVLARPFGSDFAKERRNLQELESFGLQLGRHIRYLNPQYFVHCHNKLIVVDRQAVLVSSQNWSDFAVTANREAGLVLYAPALARYYAKIFGLDWETGLQSLVRESPLETLAGLEAAPVEMEPVSLGDYMEV